jgi:uncharacterized membrane protein YdjX (TVP38/TMEM64 family)
VNRTWIIRTGLVAIALVLVVVLATSGPARELLRSLLGAIQDMGPWGAVLLVSVFIASTLLLIPTPLLTIGAGFLFGPFVGLVVGMIAVVLGAVATQLAGRLLLPLLGRTLGFRNPKWARMVEGVDEGGFGLLILLRMSYLFPYTWMNYAVALTRASVPANASATFVGMLPMIWLQVYAGSVARDLTEVMSGGEGVGVLEIVILGGGAAISVGVMLHVARVVRRKLADYSATQS